MNISGVKIVEIIMLTVVLAFSFSLGFLIGEAVGNRYGQIKALTGKIEYKLVTNPDSTRTWKYVNEEVE